MTHRTTRILVLIACCLFILAGLAIIPYAGIQNDESLFASPLYLQNPKEFCISILHHQVPLMAMTYIGTLKTLLYIPVFGLFGANVWSLRLPVVLLAACTILVLFHLGARSGNPTAGLIAALLLASDPIFLLTNTIDWGPVAIGHFLLVTGCLMLVRFAQLESHSMRDLAFGFFFFGLALWNKALFFWILAGLGCGAVFFLPEIRKLWSSKRGVAAGLGFVFGAFPFLLYNVRHRNATLSTSAHFDPPKIAWMKLPALQASLDGSGLLGYFTTESSEVPNPRNPSTLHGRVAWWIQQHTGEHRRNGMEYGLAGTFLLLPWWWRKRAAWFSLVFMAVTWLLMAFTKDAGGSVHHAVLIWPFPHFYMGIVLSSLPWERAGVAICAVFVTLNMLVLDKYIVDYERNGAAGVYTDAFYKLSDSLTDPPPELKSERRLWVVDWGILNGICLTHKGRLEVRVGDPPFMTDTPSAEDRRMIDYIINDREALFVGHVAEREVMAGTRDRLEKAVAAAGYRKEILQTISDSNGRPVFEIFKVTGQL